MKKEKLNMKLIGKYEYFLDFPKRLSSFSLSGCNIRIKFIDGEFQYIPKNSPFLKIRLTSDELETIANKLRKLNKQ